MEIHAETAARRPIAIDLFTDIVCPWCFLGNERLERVLAATGQPAEVSHHPFVLDPHTPPEGKDIPAMLREKYGVDPKQVWGRLEAEGRKSGIEVDLSKVRYSYPTIRAHTLVRLAAAKGTQRALVRDLFRANFLEARDISDLDVLTELAARHGFAAEEVAGLLTDERQLTTTRREAAEAAASGITGVPFYILDQRYAISGAQPEEVLRSAIERAARRLA
ncbi:MAG TPA: DsbA family oxidoreductase [Polyangia bacterium]|nr:DsbA family oxidoreductase [Polyangia bacterium]